MPFNMLTQETQREECLSEDANRAFNFLLSNADFGSLGAGLSGSDTQIITASAPAQAHMFLEF